MDIRIGVTYTPKELVLELDSDADADGVKTQVTEALASGDSVLWLTDKRGREIGVPADKIAYVEIGARTAEGRIGFGA